MEFRAEVLEACLGRDALDCKVDDVELESAG